MNREGLEGIDSWDFRDEVTFMFRFLSLYDVRPKNVFLIKD